MEDDAYGEVTIGALLKAGAIVAHKDGNYGSLYPRVEEFGTVGVPFLTAKSISNGKIDIAGAPRLADSRADALRFGFVEPGDVLLSHNATIGRVAVVPETDGRLLIGTSLTFFRVDPEKISPRYLAAYFSGKAFQNELAAVMSHSTRNQVPITAQRHLRVVLPSLPVQRSIAQILGVLDDKIEVNRRMNATLEALARSLFKSWFIDFDPVRAKMEGRESALASDLAALFPARLIHSPLGPIPEGWEVSRFDGIAAIVSDVVKADELAGDEHYIGLEHMPRNSISLAEWDDASGLESHKARFRIGDTLFGKLRPYFHKVGRALVDGVCSTDIVVLRAKRPIHAAYTLMHASSVEFVAFNDQSSTGTKMPRTSWGRMAEYPLVAPSDPVSQAFEEVVSPMLSRIGANVFQSRTLAQLRDLLLPKLLSGALRVRDAERMIGDAA